MSPHAIVVKLHDLGLSDAAIARLVYCHPDTIGRIRRGEESGRNLAPYLANLALVIEANNRDYWLTFSEPIQHNP